MSERGWDVTAMPSIRSCQSNTVTLPKVETWYKVFIHRVYRPDFRQTSSFGRILSSLFMLMGWSWRALRYNRSSPEVVIIGTDPNVAALVAIPWRLLRPSSCIVHWCHIAHPAVPLSTGMKPVRSLAKDIIGRLWRSAYRRCDVIADLGYSKPDALVKYGSRSQLITITPWSSVEPNEIVHADHELRQKMFGDAKLGLLYSCELGRPQQIDKFAELARLVRQDAVHFCFAGRKNDLADIEHSFRPTESNISLFELTERNTLEEQLRPSDFYMVSPRPEWTGPVVPDNFFDALACGRGVIFSGDEDATIARWIKEYKLGWVLTNENLVSIANELNHLSMQPSQLAAMQARCLTVYREVFSKEKQIEKFAKICESLHSHGSS
jgi:colanic acid biosynthesis glycosyl transferase WcaI